MREGPGPACHGVEIPAVFDLADTLDCGQAFRWQPVEGDPDRWVGAALDQPLALRRRGEKLELSCSQAAFDRVWRRYFDWEADYESARQVLAALHPVLAQAVAFAPRIRILRQDPWEALCSFLLSQNNNIARIKGLLDRFCRLFGQAIPGWDLYAFPRAEAVAALDLEDLAPLRAGYRAPYVREAARQVAAGQLDLDRISREPAAFGRQELQKLPGVGPKVAECALLYGFHKLECFPMDVWMKRAMGELLPGWLPEDFGPWAGLAQQYIFHYSRMHPERFEAKARAARQKGR